MITNMIAINPDDASVYVTNCMATPSILVEAFQQRPQMSVLLQEMSRIYSLIFVPNYTAMHLPAVDNLIRTKVMDKQTETLPSLEPCNKQGKKTTKKHFMPGGKWETE